ncbi:UNVERIFIED_CONTAM: hypothetical protein ABID98_002677 [Brevibacillus sp. OAP136]
MDGLLDLFFALLALAGKYWFVVLGYVIYRMLGLDKKKSAKEAKRSQLPPLTPTTSGGENRRVTVGQRPAASQQQDAQPMPDETGETLENRDYEWKPIPKSDLDARGARRVRHATGNFGADLPRCCPDRDPCAG